MTRSAEANKTAKPWWRYGLAWLVIGAPAVGVVAGLIILYLAVVGQDPVLNHDYYENTVDTERTAEQTAEK